MTKVQEKQRLTIVINAIEAAGYNPYAQLTGYLETGNAAYITRRGGARTMVRSLDQRIIKKYLEENSQMRLV